MDKPRPRFARRRAKAGGRRLQMFIEERSGPLMASRSSVIVGADQELTGSALNGQVSRP
jgi:hypothetical protein